MIEIPAFVIEYFLLGRTRPDAKERYTQDGGIVSDVWLEFAKDRSQPLRVLVAPSQGTSAIDLGYALHESISGYRYAFPPVSPRETPSVSPLENFVAATLYFDELLRIVLPLTTWWHRKQLGALRRKAAMSPLNLDEKLYRAILSKLGRADGEVALRLALSPTARSSIDRRVVEAAPLAALIGVFQVAEKHPEFITELGLLDPRRPGFEQAFVDWVYQHAEDIAQEARQEFSRQYETSLAMMKSHLTDTVQAQRGLEPEDPPELIQRVFLDRKASLADSDGNCTVKADAAARLFEVSCRGIAWGIIDSGIATTHPAFLDHDARDRRGDPIVPTPSRVAATFDFTLSDRIRNFDLTLGPDPSPQRAAAIAAVVTDLEKLPGRVPDVSFRQMATRNLELIARQLDQRIPPDWSLIEPLIKIANTDDGTRLVSDHGTHVAGILGADWRSGTEKLLQGVCPDIGLYDLRVVHATSRRSTEFAMIAALEYVQFANARGGNTGPVIHGVNISMQIPHEVRNYGCGATPICVACDRLVSSGVVVVAAAGNRGWNEMEMGFGNFVFCSITDPGNARDVITVGSTHRAKPHMFGVSYFSSRGPTGDGRIKPDLVAPGEQIRGPIRGNADDELDGTSMAAPFVSGAAAMLISRNRELIGNPTRIKQILCASATDLGREKYFQGHGLVDVLRAMQSL